jgi:general secretion pathway protein J
MNRFPRMAQYGFTLIEVMVALLILSALSLMSYRGLSAVLEAREHVTRETDKWRQVALFMTRFEQDVQMATPRAMHTLSGNAPAWLGNLDTNNRPHLEFSRSASPEGPDTPRRIAYQLNEKQEIELRILPAIDVSSNTLPTNYPVLHNVSQFGIQYLDTHLLWVDSWPTSEHDTAIPGAVRLHIVLASGEDIVRLFALD